MVSEPYWGYWAERTHGGHRFQAEEILQQEAQEKLYHLDSGSSLLDFGLGSADILTYYAARSGMEADVVWSMYHEYRYHAILRRAEFPGGERGRGDVR